MRRKAQIASKWLKNQIIQRGQRFVEDERGEIMGSIGWMAIVAVVLVAIHGLLTGWLPTFVQSIFTRMQSLL